MIRRLQRWMDSLVEQRRDDPHEMLNPATRVTARELIDLQQQARQLDLAMRQPARAQLAGSHASRFRGRGMDFQESRSYQAGDDIRNMDWRVTARTGRPHIKLFEEERERPVILLVDLRPSMFFATRGALKSVVAARLAALLAWVTTRHGDRVGALLFNGGHHELEPRGGHRGVMQLIQALLRLTDPASAIESGLDAGSFNDSLVRLRRIVRPGSLIVLISDFYGLDEDSMKHLSRLRRHNDMLALQIVDPIELAAPPPGRYEVSDGEHYGVLDTRSRRGRDDYENFFSQHQQQLRKIMQRQAIPLLQLKTTDDITAVLRSRFGSKRRRRMLNGRRAA